VFQSPDAGTRLLEDDAHEDVPAEQQTDAQRIASLDTLSAQILKIVETIINSIKKTAMSSPTPEEKEVMFVAPATKMVVVVGKIMSIADEIDVNIRLPFLFFRTVPQLLLLPVNRNLKITPSLRL